MLQTLFSNAERPAVREAEQPPMQQPQPPAQRGTVIWEFTEEHLRYAFLAGGVWLAAFLAGTLVRWSL